MRRSKTNAATELDSPCGRSEIDLGARHAIGNPIQLYPLYENGFRAHRNQSISDNHAESADLYAEFAKVAELNEYAWNYGNTTETRDSIGTVSKKNRMICLPFWLRPNFWYSPSISRSLDAGMKVSALERDDIDLFDFYSYATLPGLMESWILTAS
nr:hypothetical protein CFP56_74918 [Quercus suber]